MRSVALAEIDIHSGGFRGVTAHIDEGMTVIDRGDAKTSALREFDGEIARPRRNLQHGGARWQTRRQRRGLLAEPREIAGGVPGVPACDRTFHVLALHGPVFFRHCRLSSQLSQLLRYFTYKIIP